MKDPEWLVALRSAAYRLTQAEIADMTGVHKNTVSNIFARRTHPQRKILEQLATGIATPDIAAKIIALYEAEPRTPQHPGPEDLAEIIRTGLNNIAEAIREVGANNALLERRDLRDSLAQMRRGDGIPTDVDELERDLGTADRSRVR